MGLLIDLAVVTLVGLVAFMFASMVKKQLAISAEMNKIQELRKEEQDWIRISSDYLTSLYRFKNDYILVEEQAGTDFNYKTVGAVAAKKYYDDTGDCTVPKIVAFGDWWEDLMPYFRRQKDTFYRENKTTEQRRKLEV